MVSPDAEVRVLLTAREEVRQARRTGQAVKGVGAEDVAARDKADSKVTSFLTAADGVTTSGGFASAPGNGSAFKSPDSPFGKSGIRASSS